MKKSVHIKVVLLSGMACINDVEMLETQLKIIASEVEALEKQIAAITSVSIGDDSDDDSPCDPHLQRLASKLDKLMRKQNECVTLLRGAGRSPQVSIYDGY